MWYLGLFHDIEENVLGEDSAASLQAAGVQVPLIVGLQLTYHEMHIKN